MPLLPDRPLRLKPRFALFAWLKAGALAALILGMGGGFVFYGAHEARAFVAERALWETGTPGPADVGGEVTTHEWLGFIPVGREYKLDVTYLDAAGEERKARLEVTSLTEIDTDSEPEVRVDPADPSRVALSWTVEAGAGRWGFCAALAALGAAFLVGGGAMLRTTARRVASARACARRSDERELPVLSLVQQKAKGKALDRWNVTYTLPPGARGGGGKRTSQVDGTPIVLEREEGSRIVALLSPDAAEPTFPSVTLAPFEVSPDERSAFEARLEAERSRGAARQSA